MSVSGSVVFSPVTSGGGASQLPVEKVKTPFSEETKGGSLAARIVTKGVSPQNLIERKHDGEKKS